MSSETRAAIEADLRAGDSQRITALRHGVSVETVRAVMRAAGIAPKGKPNPRGHAGRQQARLERADLF